MLQGLVNYLKYFKYLINDPTTPELTTDVLVPNQTQLKYEVKGFDKEQIKSINCYVALGNSINYFQGISKKKLEKWAAVKVLRVDPLAGRDLNAYYDRFNLKFFYGKGKDSRIIYTVDSADIVTHELGHALLDAMRPDIWNLQSLEVWSFHESFSDIFATVSIMLHDAALKKVLNETNSNLYKSNVISKLGEELGIVLTGKSLRDLSIKYAYVDPKTLPMEGGDDELYAECHSFGKVFASAWYRILINLFEYYKTVNKDHLLCLKNARDCAFLMLLESIPNIPRTPNFYQSAAACMIQSSKTRNTQIQKIVLDVFKEWNLVKEVKMLSGSQNLNKLINYSKIDKNYKVLNVDKQTIVWRKLDNFMPLKDIQSLSDTSIQVQCALDSYYVFDDKGNTVYEVETDPKESILDAKKCFNYVENNNFLGKNKMWSIKRNKLLRNFII